MLGVDCQFGYGLNYLIDIKHAVMRLRGLSGARDEFVLAATVQNLKTLVLRTLMPSLTQPHVSFS